MGSLVSPSADVEMGSGGTGILWAPLLCTALRIWGPWQRGGQAGLQGVSNKTLQVLWAWPRPDRSPRKVGVWGHKARGKPALPPFLVKPGVD